MPTKANIKALIPPYTVVVERLGYHFSADALVPPYNFSDDPPVPYRESIPSEQLTTAADLLTIEQWLIDNWGGGAYLIRITDADARNVDWQFFADPRVFPKKPVPRPPIAETG